MRAFIGALLCVLALAGCTDVRYLTTGVRTTEVDPGRKVLAFYYPWYGRPDGPGGNNSWVHWDGVDPKAKTIASSLHYPVLGAYDSLDAKIIAQHTAWAKQADIDALVVSWWGPGTIEDRAMPLVLDACAQAGIGACIYYEHVLPANPDQQEAGHGGPDQAAHQITEALDRFADHPAYMKIDGRPVVFTYVRVNEELDRDGWREAMEKLRESRWNPIVVADRPDRPIRHLFDGWHTYDPMGSYHHARDEFGSVEAWADHAFNDWVDRAAAHRNIACVSITPGYDDRYFRSPGVYVEREGTKTYETMWAKAIEASPDWVLIVSFNEWHEGSEIEPSVERGRAALDITAREARRFKAQPSGASR